ncbi:DUF7662 domain-containing protein [Dactylosporangium sp. CA-139114]|uniref:DUF7662 domain-containing protein n=1 Tax=Dactylosporangium sp. CA-139114 TaxID=3239931 RepID=UPI003D97C548
MRKYAARRDRLRTPGRYEIRTSFDEISDLVPGGLPSSAYRHGAWWHNEGDAGSTLQRGRNRSRLRGTDVRPPPRPPGRCARASPRSSGRRGMRARWMTASLHARISEARQIRAERLLAPRWGCR